MSEQDIVYVRLIEQCQSDNLAQRLAALEELSKYYLDQLQGQELVDWLASTSIPKEQEAILDVLAQIPAHLPVDALISILADRDTSTASLREAVAHTLAAVKTEPVLAVLLRLLVDPNEELGLRRVIAEDLQAFGELVPFEVLKALLADPDSDILAAAIQAMSEQSALIPIDLLLTFRGHPVWYVRQVVVKTLMMTGERVPIEPIIAALSDPEARVRTAAASGCIGLLERFGMRVPLEPLLCALSDTYAPVRESILDAFAKIPEHAPLPPILTALSDADPPVRCAALETLATMPDRVPEALYATLQTMSGMDPSAHVRQRATWALLILKGFPLGPLRPIVFDPTLEELGE